VPNGFTVHSVIERLRTKADPAARQGMARYGIEVQSAFGGTSLPELRALAKEIVCELVNDAARRHEFAAGLWHTGVHEARLLAGMVDVATLVTAEQMDVWVADLESWDVCDQLCMNLFGSSPLAWEKAPAWTRDEREFVKRAGFALAAVLAVHAKRAEDEAFLPFLAAIEREAGDDRNYVKKAVNWALRQIGKRDLVLNEHAVAAARRIAAAGTRSGRWIASDALRELESPAVQARLRTRA
jgi:3-methyladenine DNA glycosylase AlkD